MRQQIPNSRVMVGDAANHAPALLQVFRDSIVPELIASHGAAVDRHWALDDADVDAVNPDDPVMPDGSGDMLEL